MLDPKELDRIMERVEQIGSGPELEQVEAVMAWCLDKFGSLGWKEEHLIQFFSLGLSNLTEDIGPMRVDYDDGSFAIAGNSDADVMDLIGLLGEGADVQVLDIDEDDLEGTLDSVVEHLRAELENMEGLQSEAKTRAIASADADIDALFESLKAPKDKGKAH